MAWNGPSVRTRDTSRKMSGLRVWLREDRSLISLPDSVQGVLPPVSPEHCTRTLFGGLGV